MRRVRGIVVAALLVTAPSGAWAGIEKAGTTAAGFLSVGAGADVLGMGGATLGFGSGLGAAAWNVAALGGLGETHYVFSHSTITGESPQDWIAAGGRFGASRTRWGLSGLYQGDGAFEGRDANNLPTGSFNASSMALGLQVAQPVGPRATVGLGLKFATEKLGDVTGGGVTFDAGVRVRAGALGFGAAAQNAFGKMSYGGATYDFPTSYGAGVAYSMPLSGLTFALDANFPSAYYSDVRGGVEWRYRDHLALRSGYRKELGADEGEPLGGPTFGMGAGANGFWLDYGFLTGGASGSGQHRVGLTYRPGFLNGGDGEAAAARSPRPAPVAKSSSPQPGYVDRARSARATAEAPRPAIVPAAPAKPARPAVAAPPAPAAIVAPTPSPAKAAPAPEPAKTEPSPKPATAPAKVEEAPKPAPAPAKVEEAPKPAPAPAKVEEAPKPAPAPAKVEEAPKPAPAPARVEEAPKPVPAPAKPAPPAARPDRVKVKDGQTLADIAKEWGNTVPALMMENNLVSEKVRPGQVLKLPAKGR